MNIESIVENELVHEPSSVWLLKGHERFGYSDGARSEQYLERAFRSVTELSSQSTELEDWIKDWASEYHLSRKRAQLLSGFRFDRKLRVLEVGCGCGAITRFLGETFDQVVSVEGSIARARLARLRTRDLESVEVICAPFQELQFKEQFDIIFCIGVYEYSASFVSGADPYTATLQYFSEMLSPNGVLVVAIENQFGLKYFCSSTEDHLGTMFEGLEGYHRRPGVVRTFGRVELETQLRLHFRNVRFYYPYPDYKIPDCVVTEEFLASGAPGELISQIRSRDYSSRRTPLWDEAATVLELARNRSLTFFSNSFLVLAGNADQDGITFDQHAVVFSPARKMAVSTITRITGEIAGQMRVRKRRLKDCVADESTRLKLRETESEWMQGFSLQSLLILRARNDGLSIREIFQPCGIWYLKLKAAAREQDGALLLPGDYVDAIWSNTYIDGMQCKFIDREWEWHAPILLNAVFIRAVYDLLGKLQSVPVRADLFGMRSGRRQIAEIAATVGVALQADDFNQFVELEAELQEIVFGAQRSRTRRYLRWFLADRPTLAAAIRLRKASARIQSAVTTMLGR